MNNLKFTVGKGNTTYDLSQLLEKVTWSGRRGSAPRTVEAVLLHTEQMDRAIVDCSEGQTCVLYEGKDELFRGLLMTEGYSSKRTLTLKAYDNCIYLCNNKGSFSFKKKRADEIFKWCLKKLGLKAGTVANTGHKIGELVKNATTYWDVIEDALSQTYAATGKRFYVRSEKGKISLIERKAQNTAIKLQPGTNTEDYDFTRSIYDTRTRLSLKTSKGKEKKSYKDTALEKKIGVFAEVANVDEKITSTELTRRVNTFKREKALVSKSLSWSGTGDTSVMSGGCIYADLSDINTKRLMYVEEDTHVWEKGKHTMKLKMAYDKTSSSTTTTTTTTGNKYKVVNTSKVNFRKSPNGTIISVLSKGTEVTGDGIKNGSWYHVKHGGKWGYIYGQYLKKS